MEEVGHRGLGLQAVQSVPLPIHALLPECVFGVSLACASRTMMGSVPVEL